MKLRIIIFFFGLINLASVEAQTQYEVGDTLPDFSFPGQFQKNFSLKEWRGSYVLVNCWASWNEESRKMQMDLIPIFIKYKDKRFRAGRKFQIISISLDEDPMLWELALKKDNLPWKNHLRQAGWNQPLIQTLKINSIPSNYLIGPNGVILAKNIAPAAIEDLLESY